MAAVVVFGVKVGRTHRVFVDDPFDKTNTMCVVGVGYGNNLQSR